MDLHGWFTHVQQQCEHWGEYFSLVAGEADPLAAMTPDRAEAWADFVLEELGPAGQGRVFGVQDVAKRNKIGRAMQALVGLHDRLVSFAESGEAAAVSAVMLSIDAALGRLGASLAEVDPAELDEDAVRSAEDILALRGVGGQEEVTPPERPPPHLQSRGSGSARVAATPPPRRRLGSGTGRREPGSGTGRREPGSGTGRREPGSGTGRREPGSGTGRREPGSGTGRREPGSGAEHPRGELGPPSFRTVSTVEDPVVPLTRRKESREPAGAPPGPAAAPPAQPESASGQSFRPTSPPQTAEPATEAPSPLRPAATDPRVALLSTFVRRLDREVLGPEEDAALEQVVAILSGALAADVETLGRRLRFLDQQFAADDDELFDPPLRKDLSRLLNALAERAVQALGEAADRAQADRLVFRTGAPELADSAEHLPVVQLAANPEGLRPGLLPPYLPRLRGPAVGLTFSVSARAGANLVRRIPENRLELGFIAGPTRLWLTALHVLRVGPRGALNIESRTDTTPAYFEARLVLPATEKTYAITERFVLAEAARYVDRLATG